LAGRSNKILRRFPVNKFEFVGMPPSVITVSRSRLEHSPSKPKYSADTSSALNVTENLTPHQTLTKIAETGMKRGNRSNLSILLSAMIGGAELSVAGLLLLKVGGGSLILCETVPGLHALLCGIVFPIGLVMIIMTGADLVTSNMMYATLPFLRKRPEINKLIVIDICRYVGISYMGNLIACVLFAAIVSTSYGLGGMATFASTIAVTKTSSPFLVALWKGVLANWLVNIAVLMSTSTNNYFAKVALIWIPISTFVTLGFEHCVANMFLIPFGIFSGAPVLWSQFFFSNLLPVTIGNFIGASILVSLMHSKAFVK